MRRRMRGSAFSTLLLLLCVPALASGQEMDHAKMMADAAASAAKTPPSQAAFATIQHIVRQLKADSSTDWSKVDLEALRRHLIDMDDVVMRAAVKQSNVAGGVSLDVTGTGKVAAAIRRMVTMHAQALTDEGTWNARASDLADGARLVVTARDPGDARAVAMLRGLGFAGIVTEGDHHEAHHLMVARGQPMAHVHKP